MLIRLTEGNGLETYVFEARITIAFLMMDFFKNDIGLKVESIPDYEPMYSGGSIDYERNKEREAFYKTEFKTFADNQPVLSIVK